MNMEKGMIHVGDNLEILRTMADNSVDAIVTDPPYGLGREPDALAMLRDWMTGGHHDVKGRGFMGKEWDAFVPQPVVWRECYRVLKPGGHVLAFAGTRTQDLMALGLRIAGFEIRDLVAWLYGSGFPKNLDVSKAIDKLDAADARRERQLQFTAWIRETGLTAAKIDDITGTNMGGHYTTLASQPSVVATRELFEKLRPYISIEVPDWIEELVNERTVESENFKAREVIATSVASDTSATSPAVSLAAQGIASSSKREIEITVGHTEDAQKWEGWGTALKPALEPITVARKPLAGTVAGNVLAHGTGALNIDGCRVGWPDGVAPEIGTPGWGGPAKKLTAAPGQEGETVERAAPSSLGRWPANVIHDGSDEVLAAFPEDDLGDRVGSTSRFFYVAKASKLDRDEGLGGFRVVTADPYGQHRGRRMEENDTRIDGKPAAVGRNYHPTVKPTNLMRYLCRLVTPPGGVVLDPYAGSGSTGKAAILEGFQFIGLEQDAGYAEIAIARLAWAREELRLSSMQQGLFA